MTGKTILYPLINRLSKTTANMKRIRTNKNNVDRISSLPDQLLLLILSLLPCKEKAITSVLSKRWQKLRLETITLEYNENSFLIKNSIFRDSVEDQRRHFIEFAKKRLQSYHPGQSIGGLKLIFSDPGNYMEDMRELVKLAIDRNVTRLVLDFSDPTWNENSHVNHEPVFELPSFVYEHQNLESIELYGCKVNVSEFKNPSQIKKFFLGWTNLSNSQFSEFLAKCTSLQEFSLKKCWNVGVLTISASTMKNLVLDKCSDLNGHIDIDAKNLKTFKYLGEMISFNMEYLSTLDMAEVDFANEEDICEDAEYLYILLNELWSTKVLTVCGYLLQLIPSAPEYPDLTCLRKLILKTSLDRNEYDGISYMLTSSPNLESLTFDLSPRKIFQDQATHLGIQDHIFLNGHKYKEYGLLFKCLRTLKKVKVLGFKGNFYETKAIKYLISSGIALKKARIILSDEKGPNGMNMGSTYRFKAQTLLTCPKASRGLNIRIENPE